jgi:hypothetical protein
LSEREGAVSAPFFAPFFHADQPEVWSILIILQSSLNVRLPG